MRRTDDKNLRALDKHFESKGFLQRLFLFCFLIAVGAGALINFSFGSYLLFYLLMSVFALLSLEIRRDSFKSDNYFWVKDLHFGSGKIDHVCVGPTGIFAIETNDYDGRVYYYDGHLLLDGRKKGRDFMKEAKEDASFLSDLIFKRSNKRYHVVPMVIFPNANIDKSVKDKKDDIWIGNEKFKNYIIRNSNYFIPKGEVLNILNFLIEEKEKISKDGQE